MANTYSDTTGVLAFEGPVNATPVIRALFGAFELTPDVPGGKEAYIAKIADSSWTTWNAVAQAIEQEAENLSIRCPDPQVNPDDDDEIVVLLRLLAARFNNVDAVNLFLEERDIGEDDDADLRDLFELATLFDDGHGLVSVCVETAWHCDKPKLFEFGGAGEHYSRHLEAVTTSTNAIDLGQQVDQAMLEGRLDAAADSLAQHACLTLDWIVEDDLRAATRSTLARLAVFNKEAAPQLQGGWVDLFVGAKKLTPGDCATPRWVHVRLDQPLVDKLWRQHAVSRIHELNRVEFNWAETTRWDGFQESTTVVVQIGDAGFSWRVLDVVGLASAESVPIAISGLGASIGAAVASGERCVRLHIPDDRTWQACLDTLRSNPECNA